MLEHVHIIKRTLISKRIMISKSNRLRIIYELRIFCRLTIIEERNATIEHILINNPACSECISKINNETLCFKMLINGTKNETQISCLMNEGLL